MEKMLTNSGEKLETNNTKKRTKAIKRKQKKNSENVDK